MDNIIYNIQYFIDSLHLFVLKNNAIILYFLIDVLVILIITLIITKINRRKKKTKLSKLINDELDNPVEEVLLDEYDEEDEETLDVVGINPSAEQEEELSYLVCKIEDVASNVEDITATNKVDRQDVINRIDKKKEQIETEQTVDVELEKIMEDLLFIKQHLVDKIKTCTEDIKKLNNDSIEDQKKKEIIIKKLKVIKDELEEYREIEKDVLNIKKS